MKIQKKQENVKGIRKVEELREEIECGGGTPEVGMVSRKAWDQKRGLRNQWRMQHSDFPPKTNGLNFKLKSQREREREFLFYFVCFLFNDFII